MLRLKSRCSVVQNANTLRFVAFCCVSLRFATLSVYLRVTGETFSVAFRNETQQIRILRDFSLAYLRCSDFDRFLRLRDLRSTRAMRFAARSCE